MPQQLLLVNQVQINRGNDIIIKNASLSLEKSQHLFITGRSGSGKSSLAMAIAGKIYSHGVINLQFDNQSILKPEIKFISQFYQFKNKSGLNQFYYQQRFNSYDASDAITVRECINYDTERNDSKNLLLDLLKLSHRLDACLLELSSGERKKLQLVKELSDPTQLIIIDNPYIGLDTESVFNLNKYLSVLAEKGATFIIIADYSSIPEFITHIAEINSDKTVTITTTESSSNPSNINSTSRISLVPKKNYEQLQNDNGHKILVKLEQVSVSYANKSILTNINWAIKEGEKWFISGANGAGKSTLLSLINADHPQAYANNIELFGKRRGSGESIWEIKQNIGFVSPELHWNFDQSLSCEDAVLSGFFDTPGLYTKPTTEHYAKAQFWLEQLELTKYKEMKFSAVSLGIQRMLLLARAIVKNPPLFIFDEPCQGLDEHSSNLFIDLIDRFFATNKHTILFVSHRQDQIPVCINRILRLENGHVYY